MTAELTTASPIAAMASQFKFGSLPVDYDSMPTWLATYGFSRIQDANLPGAFLVRLRLTRLPIRTAESGNRDQRALQCISSPNPTVSGSDSERANPQNPAESRQFLGPSLDTWEESLPTQTQWRWGGWGELVSSVSSLIDRESTGKSSNI